MASLVRRHQPEHLDGRAGGRRGLFRSFAHPVASATHAPDPGGAVGLHLQHRYALGAGIEWVWNFLELKLPRGWVRRVLGISVALGCIGLVLMCLSRIAEWQDSVRSAMGLAPVGVGEPVAVVLVALVPAIILVVLGTLLAHAVEFVSRRLAYLVPPRVAILGGLVIVGVLASSLFSGFLLRGALRARRRWIWKIFSRVAVGVVALLVAGFAWLSLLPLHEDQLLHSRSAGQPAASYEAALQRYEATRVSEGSLDLNPLCLTKLLTHGNRVKRVVIFFHGLTNCPAQLDELAPKLFDEGYNV